MLHVIKCCFKCSCTNERIGTKNGIILNKTSQYDNSNTILLDQFINNVICFEVKIILTSSVSYSPFMNHNQSRLKIIFQKITVHNELWSREGAFKVFQFIPVFPNYGFPICTSSRYYGILLHTSTDSNTALPV